jgi:hypothetical protein
LINYGNTFIINAHKFKSNISLLSANEAKKIISSSRKSVLIFLKVNQLGKESSRVKESLERCTKEKKTTIGGVL